jgi:hypothetical protein
MMIRPEIRRFQSSLSRVVTEAERGSVPTFYDMAPAMLEEARRVRELDGIVQCVEYLRFFVVESAEEDVLMFYDEVVTGGGTLAGWRTEDRLVSIGEQRREPITFDVPDCVRRLDRLDGGERWFRVDFGSGNPANVPFPTSGPGVRFRNMKYWSRIELSSIEDAEVTYVSGRSWIPIDVDHIDIEIRRWVAAQAAWSANEYLRAARAPTADGIAAAAYKSKPSPDGWIALRALAREAVSGDPRWPSQPGRIGPDDWYLW